MIMPIKWSYSHHSRSTVSIITVTVSAFMVCKIWWTSFFCIGNAKHSCLVWHQNHYLALTWDVWDFCHPTIYRSYRRSNQDTIQHEVAHAKSRLASLDFMSCIAEVVKVKLHIGVWNEVQRHSWDSALHPRFFSFFLFFTPASLLCVLHSGSHLLCWNLCSQVNDGKR